MFPLEEAAGGTRGAKEAAPNLPSQVAAATNKPVVAPLAASPQEAAAVSPATC